MLEIASLFEGKFDIGLVAGAGNLDEKKAPSIAYRLELLGFLSRDLKGNYGFSHDRIHETMRSKIPQEKRESLYEKLGFLSEALLQEKPEYAFNTAEYFFKSKNITKAIESCYNAAEYARGKIAFDAAVKYYKNASLAAENAEKLQIKSSVDVVKIQMGLGEVLLLMRNNEQAFSFYKELLEYPAANGVNTQQIKYAIGVIYSNLGEFTQAISCYRELLALQGYTFPSNRKNILLCLFVEYLQSIFSKQIVSFQKNSDIRVSASVMNRLAYALYFEDVFFSIMIICKSFNTVKKLSQGFEMVESLTHYAVINYCFLLKKRSAMLFQKAHLIANQSDRKDMHANVFLFEGQVQYFAAHWGFAVEKFNSSISFYREIGNISDQIISYEHLWRIELMRGDFVKMRNILNDTISICNRTKEKHFLSASLAGLAYINTLKTGVFNLTELNQLNSFIALEPAFLTKTHVALMLVDINIILGKYNESFLVTQEFIPLIYKKSFNTEYNVPFFVISCDLAILYLRKEKLGQKLLDVPSSKIKKDLKKHLFMLRFSSISYPAYRGSYYRIKAWQAALKKQPKRAIQLFDRALHEFHKLDMRYEEAKTYREYAEFYGDANIPGSAREKYNEAYRLFLICGAHYEARKIEALVDTKLVLAPVVEDRPAHTPSKSISSEIDTIRVDSLHALCASMTEAENIQVLSRQILKGIIKATGAQYACLLTDAFEHLGASRTGMSFDGSDLENIESYVCEDVVKKVRMDRLLFVAWDIKSVDSVDCKNLASGRSVCCLPLNRGGKYLGCIYLGNDLVSGLFSENAQKAAEIIAAQSGIMLENAFLMDRYRNSAVELAAKVKEQTKVITEKNRLLEESTLRLVENEQMKTILAGTLVHDINNYILGIAGGAQILNLRKTNSPEDTKLLLMMKARCNDVADLASNLLDIQKVEDGRMPINRELLDLEVLQSMVYEFQKHPTFISKNIAIIVLPPSQSITLYADQYLMQRVIQNLMSNAAKYGAENGEVTLSYELDADTITLCLFSAGTPIPENYRGILFDKYTQAGQGRSQYSKGLGLFFCKMVLQEHGGRIWVETQERGNVFKMAFPKSV